MFHWVMTFLMARQCSWCLQSGMGLPVAATRWRGGHGGVRELIEKKKKREREERSWWRRWEGERQLGFQEGTASMVEGVTHNACSTQEEVIRLKCIYNF
jgi:hypothetical protein